MKDEAKKRYMKLWREKNREKIVAYRKKYRAEHLAEIKELLKAWRSKNIERYREHRRNWRKGRGATKEQRAKKSAYNRLWRMQNKEKARAHNLICYAKYCGACSPPNRCEGCGNEDVRIEGHHYDYSRPLEVRWLCSVCHKRLHQGVEREVEE